MRKAGGIVKRYRLPLGDPNHGRKQGIVAAKLTTMNWNGKKDAEHRQHAVMLQAENGRDRSKNADFRELPKWAETPVAARMTTGRKKEADRKR